MANSFSVIVATHLRQIASALDRTPRPAEGAATPGAVAVRAAIPPPLLDIVGAECLGNGNFVFPALVGSDGAPVGQAWHVFSSEDDGDDGVLLLHHAGGFGVALDDDTFVEHAYRIVLRRLPDPEGRRAYHDSLLSARQTRHGVLRDLAGSLEAAGMKRLLVIAPGDRLADPEQASPGLIRIDLGMSLHAAA